MIDSPENELLIRAKAGDTDAEEELVRTYLPTIRRTARSYAHLGTDTDDLIQEGALATIRAAREHSGRCRFSTFAIGGMKLAMHMSTRRAPVLAVPDDEVAADGTPEESFEAKERSRRMADLVAKCDDMDDIDRRIFTERILQERGALLVEELAARLGIHRGSVWYRETRLRKTVLPKLFAELR